MSGKTYYNSWPKYAIIEGKSKRTRMSLNIVIMAGGSGTRLWPMSRTSSPKQLQKLIGDQTLIQQTYDRLQSLVDGEHVFVSTVGKYVTEMQKQLPTIPPDHFITEPMLKNTAPAIGLAAIHLLKRDPDAIMVSIHSDHAVTKKENFLASIKLAHATVQKHPHYLLTIGVKPEYASTELGYIQMDDALENNVYKVKRFVEKPDRQLAEDFLADGHYLWNAGYFVWKVSTLLELFKQFVPNTYQHLMAIHDSIGTSEYEAVLQEHYAQMDEIAIDYAILERAPYIAVIPADLGWSDIGSWGSLHDIISAATGKQLVSKGNHIHHATEDSLVYSVGGKLVATVGLKNVIVVDTPEILLVADKSRVHEVKKIVEQLKADESKHMYL